MTGYEITIQFTGGTLEGLTYTYTANQPREVGREVLRPYGNTSPYRVVTCVPIAEAA